LPDSNQEHALTTRQMPTLPALRADPIRCQPAHPDRPGAGPPASPCGTV